MTPYDETNDNININKESSEYFFNERFVVGDWEELGDHLSEHDHSHHDWVLENESNGGLPGESEGEDTHEGDEDAGEEDDGFDHASSTDDVHLEDDLGVCPWGVLLCLQSAAQVLNVPLKVVTIVSINLNHFEWTVFLISHQFLFIIWRQPTFKYHLYFLDIVREVFQGKLLSDVHAARSAPVAFSCVGDLDESEV